MALAKAVDNLYLYDPEFERGARHVLNAVGGSSAMHPIKSWDDVKTALSGYTLVKFLVFDTHGSPGNIHLADGTRVQGVDFSLLPPNPRLLKEDARVLFLGCNVGQGSAGDRFLAEIGSYLLRGKGGTVGATTVTNRVFQLGPFASETYMSPLSGGELKTKRYNPAGMETGSRTVDRYGAVR